MLPRQQILFEPQYLCSPILLNKIPILHFVKFGFMELCLNPKMILSLVWFFLQGERGVPGVSGDPGEKGEPGIGITGPPVSNFGGGEFI